MISQVQAFFRPYDATSFKQASKPYRFMLQIDRYLSWSNEQNRVLPLWNQPHMVRLPNTAPMYQSALKILSFAGIAASLYLFPEKRRAILTTLAAMLLTKIIFRLYMTKDHQLEKDVEDFFSKVPKNFFLNYSCFDLIPLIPDKNLFKFSMSEWTDHQTVPVEQFIEWILRAVAKDRKKTEQECTYFIEAITHSLKTDEGFKPSELDAIFLSIDKIAAVVKFKEPYNLKPLFSPYLWLRIQSLSEQYSFTPIIQSKNDALFAAIVRIRASQDRQRELPMILDELHSQLQELPNGSVTLFHGLATMLTEELNYTNFTPSGQDPRVKIQNILDQADKPPTYFQFSDKP